MDGTEGPAAQAARDWAGALSEATGLPAALWDERLSSAAVNRFLIGEADASRARRAAAVDQMAAAGRSRRRWTPRAASPYSRRPEGPTHAPDDRRVHRSSACLCPREMPPPAPYPRPLTTIRVIGFAGGNLPLWVAERNGSISIARGWRCG